MTILVPEGEQEIPDMHCLSQLVETKLAFPARGVWAFAGTYSHLLLGLRYDRASSSVLLPWQCDTAIRSIQVVAVGRMLSREFRTVQRDP